jgi:hypothetical protein
MHPLPASGPLMPPLQSIRRVPPLRAIGDDG